MHGYGKIFGDKLWAFPYAWKILYPRMLRSLIWAPTLNNSCPMQSRQFISEEKNTPIFCLSGRMFIVRYSVHHVKYKSIVIFHIYTYLVLLFYNSLHPCSSVWHYWILSLFRIQQERLTPSQALAPSILFLLIPLPKVLFVCQEIAELPTTNNYLLLSSSWCVYML